MKSAILCNNQLYSTVYRSGYLAVCPGPFDTVCWHVIYTLSAIAPLWETITTAAEIQVKLFPCSRCYYYFIVYCDTEFKYLVQAHYHY